MDQLIITGGAPLRGTLTVSGSKNAVLPMMCAALMAETPCELRNVPDLRDVRTLCRLLEALGVRIEFTEPGVLVMDPRAISTNEAPYEWVKQMRASVCLLGPLIARFGEARVSMPGGCVIGPRPVDLHLKGLAALGVSLSMDHGDIVAKGRPKGGNVFLGGRFGSSVTATANCLMAAVKASGTTMIESAAMEPEINDLALFLNAMGAKIGGIGSHALQIEGVTRLEGVSYTVIPDRIEAGTFLLAGALTQGDLFVQGARPSHLRALLEKMQASGALISEEASGIRVTACKRPKSLEIITLPYPGFPTDLQAQMMSLMCLSEGIAVMTEKIYPERFMHIAELNRMGARIALEGSTAIIQGVPSLSGAKVMASDLRASAALLLAAMVAEGETVLDRVYHLDRGYERIEEKLCRTGARIVRRNPAFDPDPEENPLP